MIKKDGRLVKRFWFQMYECSRVEKFLTEMAEKGWMLEKLKGNQFTFQPCSPSKINFSVNIFDDSLGYGSYKEATRTYLELCEKAGWEFIGNWQKVYIFYTQDYNAVSIETDDELTLSIINKNILKENIYHWFIVPVLSGISNGMLLDNFKSLISEYLSLAILVTWVVLIINAIVGIVSYVTWYYSSKKRIKGGKELRYYDGKNKSILMRINLQFGCVLFILLSIAGILNGDIVLLIIMVVLLVCFIYSIYKSKSESWSKKVKRNVMVTMIFLAIMMIGLGTTISILNSHDFRIRNELLMYREDGGLSFSIINHDELPVTLEEYGILLENNDNIKKETTADVSSTIFAQDYTYSDYYITKHQEYLMGINYELFQSDFQWVIDWYLDDEWSDPDYGIEITNADPTRFKAEKLYIQELEENSYRYIAVYGKKVLILELDEEPTNEQINLFLNKLIYS